MRRSRAETNPAQGHSVGEGEGDNQCDESNHGHHKMKADGEHVHRRFPRSGGALTVIGGFWALLAFLRVWLSLLFYER